MTYPRAWIAQDWAEQHGDGAGEAPGPPGDGEPLPPFAPAWAYIDTGEEAIEDRRDWPSAEDAIAWARERVRVVLVRVGSSDYHSAGDEHPPGVPLWPPTEDAIRHEPRRSS